MRITVLEECHTTHLLTYELDVDTLEEGIKEIESGLVDYRDKEWLREDDHTFDKKSFEEEKQYRMILNDLPFEYAAEERVIEYAANRLEANEEDRKDFNFDTRSMNIMQAIEVIQTYGELVQRRF